MLLGIILGVSMGVFVGSLLLLMLEKTGGIARVTGLAIASEGGGITTRLIGFIIVSLVIILVILLHLRKRNHGPLTTYKK